MILSVSARPCPLCQRPMYARGAKSDRRHPGVWFCEKCVFVVTDEELDRIAKNESISLKGRILGIITTIAVVIILLLFILVTCPFCSA